MSENYAFLATLRPQSYLYRRGKAELSIFNFRSTWSEFQKASQTVTEEGNAELRIFDFKTT